MGAYLSEPVRDKELEEYCGSGSGSGLSLSCAAATMQGWRISQEDAHNCILNYDTNMSLFAVYDGHGGAEVAKYCAQSLPDFIKKMDAFGTGDYRAALEDAFLAFDATITEAETIKLLKTLKNEHEGEDTGDSEFDDEEDIKNLYREASLPLKTIMAKYMQGKKLGIESEDGLDPFKPDVAEHGRSGSSEVNIETVGSSKVNDGAGCSSKSSDDREPDVSSSDETVAGCSKIEQVTTTNGERSHGDRDVGMEGGSTKNDEKPDSSGDVHVKPADDSSEKSHDPFESNDHCNGGIEDDQESKENVSSSQENGKSSSSSKKGKAIAKANSGVTSSSNNAKPRRNAAAVAAAFYSSIMEGYDDEEEEEEEESVDETFQTDEESDSDAEGVANGDCSSEEEEDSDEDEDEEEEEEYDEVEALRKKCFADCIKNEPGSDSGCTAVVALLHNDKLYVANAGDSRCIVCRDGEPVEMSIDHKPEDELELTRIQAAGGRVSSDGRVNDGLNLSRAIGDHGYKQKKELGPKEQMITAFPDIRTLTIEPGKDEFMVLACDGIWNSMTSEAVVKFVKTRLDSGVDSLTQICSEMFDHCLAPNTCGDGTGCDNMTAIIVKFNSNNKRNRETEGEESHSTKRAKSTDEESP